MNVMPYPVPNLVAQFIARPLRLLIGDAWVNAKSGKTFDVFDLELYTETKAAAAP
jgi:hypothetical protein